MWHFFAHPPEHPKDDSQEPLCEQGHASEQMNRNLRQNLTASYSRPICRVAGALFALITLMIIGYRLFESKDGTVYSCGTTPEEAVERDCQFDMLSFAWVPKPCFDADLSSTYNVYEAFEFFYHREKSDKIPVEELRKGINKQVYTSGRYHRTHCTYAWKILQRAVLQGYHLSDNKTLSPEHYDHCSYYLVDVDHSYRAQFTMEYLHCQAIPSQRGLPFW